MLIAVVPNPRRQLGKRGRQGMYGVVRELRISDVPLHAMHREAAAQAAASTDFDGIAEKFLARWLADQAPVDRFLPLPQYLDHPARAVDRRPFFVAGYEESDGTPMIGIAMNELLARRQHGR